MGNKKWAIFYITICMIVALVWTLALVKDIVTASWMIFLSGSQAFLMWLAVVDGIATILKLKKKSGFDI